MPFVKPLHQHHDHGHHEHERDHGGRCWSRIKHAVVPHSHDAAGAMETSEETSSLGVRAAWIGLAGMLATAVAQVLIVAISGSVALMADTVHNLGHVATTVPLIIAFRIGRRPASKRYPYGMRRAEDLAGLFIGLIVLLSAVLIIWEAIRALIEPRELTNLWWVFAAGVVGFLGNEAVAEYRIRTGRRIESAALIAEGQHARADGLTSIAVVLGVLGVWAGFPRADGIVGLLIGFAVLGILVATMRTVVRRLMDGVDDDVVDRLRAIAADVPGVEAVERMRARWIGHRMYADLTIHVDPVLSVASARDTADRVEAALIAGTKNLDAVLVHVRDGTPA